MSVDPRTPTPYSSSLSSGSSSRSDTAVAPSVRPWRQVAVAASFAVVLLMTVLVPSSASGQSDSDPDDGGTSAGLSPSGLAGVEADTSQVATPSIAKDDDSSDGAGDTANGSITVAPDRAADPDPAEQQNAATTAAPADADTDADASGAAASSNTEATGTEATTAEATETDATGTEVDNQDDGASTDTDTDSTDETATQDADQSTEASEESQQDPAAQEEAETADDGEAVAPAIVFPVVGPVNFSDTWGACRGRGCSRSHKGADLFGAKLAPLVAAADGVVSSERRSGLGLGGNTVIITTDDGWRYLYIHLNNDSPGSDDGSNPQGWIIPNRLRKGDRVKAGDVIGYLGDSGNAETTPAHLHFEIHEPGVGAINPTPFVQAAQDEGRVVSVASLASSAEGRALYGPTVDAWYRALLKREPTRMELFAWTDRFDIGFATTDDLIADLTMSKPRRDPAGAIVRSFEVALDRRPTINELRLWEEEYRSGRTLEQIAAVLIESGPFTSKNGDLTDAQFIGVIYRNAIGADPSEKRLADWLTAFEEGTTRAGLAAYWADSYTLKNSTWHGLEVIQAFRASLDRLPTDAEHDRWVDHLNRGGLIPDVVAAIRAPADSESDSESNTDSSDDAETDSESNTDSSDDAETDSESNTDSSDGAETDSESNTDSSDDENEPDADEVSGDQ